jgi:hypothetical protein
MRWLLLAVLVLAGCSDPPAEPAESVDDPGAAASASGATSATAVSAPPAVALEEAVPFTWAGHTKEGAWVCMEQGGTGQCPAGQQVSPDGQHVTAIAYAGDLTAVQLTMSWQADATQTGLVLAAYGNTSSGRGLLASVQGDSPLTLAIDAAVLGLVPDNVVVLMVWPEGKTATSPSLFVDATQQAFTVEGTLRQRP